VSYLGHSGQSPKAPPSTVARISRFASDGKFTRSFGRLSSGPGEFRTPHDIAIDEKGRLFVADRGNHRIQVLDLEGTLLAQWKQYGRPLRGGLVYVADSESNGVAPNPGWKRGIRVGEIDTGKVLYRILDRLKLNGTSAAYHFRGSMQTRSVECLRESELCQECRGRD
jgi:NHL repeat